MKSLLLLCLLQAVYGLLPPPDFPDAFSVAPVYVYEGGALCDLDSGCLTLSDTTSASGSDALGAYVGLLTTYTTAAGARVTTIAKLYDNSDLTVYETSFPDGLSGCTTGDGDGTCTGYPVFNLIGEAEEEGLRFVTPGDNMCGWGLYSQGSFWTSHTRFRTGAGAGIAGFIIPDSYSLVVSPLQHPMAVGSRLSVEGGSAQLHYGVQGLAGDIPAGFTVSVIAVTGLGSPQEWSFGATVRKWGGLVQQLQGTSKVSDPSAEYLGYWTDNGAYYYYYTDVYPTYQDLLVQLRSYLDEIDVPVRYVQLDSWWYHKGAGGGVKNWTAMSSVFPDGLEVIHEQTEWPILAHNRYFASDTDYASQNGGQYPFFIDDDTQKAVPLDQSFWDDLFDDALQWGLSVYEQDWLDREYEGVSALHDNVTLADDWLHSMAAAAAQRSLAVQYCMALPREMVHGAQEEAVTQIRVSDDYHLDMFQWRIGHTSLFAHALGLRPYKDVFWTSSDNVNNPYAWCQTFQSSPGGTSTSYVGHVNVTESGTACVHWEDVDYRARYPFDSLSENFCRNPGGLQERAFCFTSASLDVPEEDWTWEYCDVPTCDVDCYVQKGLNYVGEQSVTEQGYDCVDWDGLYGLTGPYCRNPDTSEERPWCFITPSYTAIDFCDNKCPEAVEYNPALQAAVATLSRGPVAIGDKMENIDRELVMKSVRPDGKILGPGQPMTAIDLYFLNDSRPNIWTTETTIGEFTFGMIFVAEVEEELALTAQDLNLEKAMSTDFMYFKSYPYDGTFGFGNENTTVRTPVTGNFMDFTIISMSPIFRSKGEEYALVGETDKWVPASFDRIREIVIDDITFNVFVEGYEYEQIIFNVYRLEGSFSELMPVRCTFRNATEISTARIDVHTQICYEPEF